MMKKIQLNTIMALKTIKNKKKKFSDSSSQLAAHKNNLIKYRSKYN